MPVSGGTHGAISKHATLGDSRTLETCFAKCSQPAAVEVLGGLLEM